MRCAWNISRITRTHAETILALACTVVQSPTYNDIHPMKMERREDDRSCLEGPICIPAATRSVSPLDFLLKFLERLFSERFLAVPNNRGNYPDYHSDFRPKRSLQTRVLLFIEQVELLMTNSSPKATAFVDFRSAFDQLWFTRWLEIWLKNRRTFIEIAGKRSDLFSIRRGGPQGSSLTPSIFISYQRFRISAQNWTRGDHSMARKSMETVMRPGLLEKVLFQLIFGVSCCLVALHRIWGSGAVVLLAFE